MIIFETFNNDLPLILVGHYFSTIERLFVFTRVKNTETFITKVLTLS